MEEVASIHLAVLHVIVWILVIWGQLVVKISRSVGAWITNNTGDLFEKHNFGLKGVVVAF